MRLRILNQHFSFNEARRLWRPAVRAMTPRRARNALALWRACRRRATRVPGLPAIMMVEVSSVCDMECPMCPANLHPSGRRTGLMDMELYRSIIDEVGDTVAIMTPWNFGEPLLHPQLPDMIEIAKRKGVLTALNTNARTLDRAKADALIDSGLDSLTISFDGAAKETYERFRGKGNFERVCHNARQLVARRAAKRSPTPLIILQFIVMRGNEHEIPAIEALAAQWGVDKLALKRFSYLEENGAAFRPSNPALAMPLQPPVSPCSRLWLSTTVLSDGRVTPCCGDLGFGYIMGTLTSGGGLADIWNGAAYRRMRALAARSMRSIPMCQTCPSHNFTARMFVERHDL